ncbi:MAG: hypothetical protein NDJ90_11715 [Oligoflexia bacterium]|nr:hypothetical protein [Oligoflexia bacterium]
MADPTSELFKKCTGCGQNWATRAVFLADSMVELVGYQARLDDIERGIFLFTHLRQGCKTTMGIRVLAFKDLHREKRRSSSSQAKNNTPECEGHCLHVDDLDRCTADCANAWIRELLQTLKEPQHS